MTPAMRQRPTLQPRNGSDLRRDNAASVLGRLLWEGPLPRIDLSVALGLTTGALTRITAELAERGLIEELDPVASSEAGRRRVPLDVRASDFVAAGVHVGLDLTTYGLVDLRGRLVGEPKTLDHGPLSPAGAVAQARRARDLLLGDVPPHARFIGTGFVSGGFEIRREGAFAISDVLGWEGEYLAPLLEGMGEVEIDNSYRALSRAEMWFGATRDASNFIQIFLGNLVGASIVVDRQTYDGAGARPGQIAHFPVTGPALRACRCGRNRCFTSVAGLDAILEGARAAGLGADVTWSEIVRRSNADDAVAQRFHHQRLTALGEVIALLIDLFAPERVVLSGAIPTGGSGLEVVRASVKQFTTTGSDTGTVVTPTALGNGFAANVISAATARLETFYRDPLGETSVQLVGKSS